MEKLERERALLFRKMKRAIVNSVNSLVKTKTGCCCIPIVMTLFAVVCLLAGLNNLNRNIQNDETYEVIPLDLSREVHQPFCKIFSINEKFPKSDRLDGALCNPHHPRTGVLDLPNGNVVLEKLGGSKCIKCCFRKIILLNGQLRRIKQCIPIYTIRGISPIETAMVQTSCTNECDYSATTEDDFKGTSTALHALFPVTRKVKEKMDFWKDRMAKPKLDSKQNSENTGVIILNIENLSRQQARHYLPQTLDILKEFGFVEMKGFSQVSADPASNTIASLTGLDAQEWDSTCSYSEIGHLDKCPFIWKMFDASQYITSYAEDVPIVNSHKNSNKRGFVKSPVDYFLRHNLYESMNNQSSLHCRYSDSIRTLLEFSARINKKFLDYPLFSFTRIGSANHSRVEYDLDNQLKSFLLNLKRSLKKSLVVVYSNYGIRVSSKNEQTRHQAGISNNFEPLLLISLPNHFKDDFAQNLIMNAGRLTTMLDLYRTLEHVAELNHIGLKQATSNEKFKSNEGTRGASLLNLVSTQRSCQDAHVPEESCPCDLNLISGKFKLTGKVRAAIIEEVLRKLNSLVPNHDLCTTFTLKWLDNIIPIRDPLEQQILDLLIQYRVGVMDTANKRKEASIEQRVRVDKKSWKVRAIGMPVWTTQMKGNGDKCLHFLDNPKAFYMEKQFCVCKYPENFFTDVEQPQ